MHANALGHSANMNLLPSIFLGSTPGAAEHSLQALLPAARPRYPVCTFLTSSHKRSLKRWEFALHFSTTKKMKICILISFLSFEDQFINLGIFNFKPKYDRKKFLCSPKCERVGEEKKHSGCIQQYFSWALLPSFITIFNQL